MNPVLENELYQLFMQGFVSHWTESGTADHYVDYVDNYEQWRGDGVVVDKASGRSIQFTCSTEASRRERYPHDARELLLRTDYRDSDRFHFRSASLMEIALQGKDSLITTFICQKLLEKVAKCTDPIKRVILEPLSFKELVEAGIVADHSGQISIPTAV